MKIALLMCVPAGVVSLLALAPGWTANPEVVRTAAANRPQFNFDESRVPRYDLPDVFGGRSIRTPEDWTSRRAQILELFREHVYGRSPGPPDAVRFDVVEQNERAMDGAATLKRVSIMSTQSGRQHRFDLTIFLPNAVAEAPMLLFMNNRLAADTDASRNWKSGFWPAEEIVARGYGIAAIANDEVAPDDKDRYADGVIRLFEGNAAGSTRAANSWRALAAWGWAAKRAMDYLERDVRIDAERIGLVGHSRGGKAALWAAAEDERFALVVSNESGEGGAALTRRNFGETQARINDTFPHGFAAGYRPFSGRGYALPLDQHMLLALVAPRALYVASADEDLWSDPRGEFLSLAAASPVFALWGDRAIRPDDMPPLESPLVVGRRAYHIRRGVHDLTPYDWERFVDFADLQWRGRPTPAARDLRR